MLTHPTILIVDDEPAIGKMLERALKNEGFFIDIAPNGEDALDLLARKKHDVVILDINLPGISGDEICRQLRKDPLLQTIGILMVTGRNTEGLSASMLDDGADDYVSKPFDLNEVVARVKALLRRPRVFVPAESVIQRKNIHIDLGARQISITGRPVDDFTPKEFELLSQLVIHSPRVLDKNTLALKVWGVTRDGLHDRTIDVHIRRIRKKLGDYAACLKTIQTIGYQWLDAPDV